MMSRRKERRNALFKRENISFNYKSAETKYYLLTSGSGYALAEFNFPHLPDGGCCGIVIPEIRE